MRAEAIDSRNAEIARLEGEAAAPVIIDATPDPVDEDRAALNAWLDEAGYRRIGDLVYLTPVRSETPERFPASASAVAVLSLEQREGEVFQPHGARLERFRKNPVVLFNHDYDGLPVARSLWERVRVGETDIEFIAKPQFHRDTALSREVLTLIEDGRLSAWELGVLPERWTKTESGYVVEAWDILEYSVVPRPEDMPALREERRQGRISSPALVKSILEKGEVDVD